MADSTTNNSSINRVGQSFVDASLSEEQWSAIIQQASMANKDLDNEPDEILEMIDENCSLISNQTNQEELSNLSAFSPLQSIVPPSSFQSIVPPSSFQSIVPPPSSFHRIPAYQNNFMPNFPNPSSSYLPYFPMNIYHHQILMDQAAHQVAQQAVYFNQNVTGCSQFDYNGQNLDNYIETVFEDQHEQNQSNPVYMNYGNGEVNPLQTSKENGVQSHSQASDENAYKISVQFERDSAFQPPQPSKHQMIDDPKSNQLQKIYKPLPIKSRFRPSPKPTGSIKKVGVMPTFPPNTTLIPCQQPNVYLISNEANTIPKNNFQYMISPQNICIRPPFRTKQSIMRTQSMSTSTSQEPTKIFKKPSESIVKEDYLSKIDFSSLDTSEIIITKIAMPETPLHKKRKQELINLKDCDITYQVSEKSKNNEMPVSEHNSPARDQKTTEKDSLSQKDTEKVDVSKLNSYKNDDVYTAKRSRKGFKKLISKQVLNFDDYTDDDDHDDSDTDKISSKSLKCSICMKIFKSSQTLAKHRKQNHLVDQISVHGRQVNDVKKEEVKKSLQNFCEKIAETASNVKDSSKIEDTSEVENSLAELFAEKPSKSDEENSIHINSNINEADFGDDKFKAEDRVEESLAVLFSEGPSKREFEKFSFEKCSAIETNEINKLNMLQSSLKKDGGNEKLSNKRKRNTLIPVDHEMNLKKSRNCDDLLDTLTPKPKPKSTRKQQNLKIELNKQDIVQYFGNSSSQKDNAKASKKMRKKRKNENAVEEENSDSQKRKTRSQTKRKNETEMGITERKK